MLGSTNYNSFREEVLNTIAADIKDGDYNALRWLIDQIDEQCGSDILLAYISFYDTE